MRTEATAQQTAVNLPRRDLLRAPRPNAPRTVVPQPAALPPPGRPANPTPVPITPRAVPAPSHPSRSSSTAYARPCGLVTIATCLPSPRQAGPKGCAATGSSVFSVGRTSRVCPQCGSGLQKVTVVAASPTMAMGDAEAFERALASEVWARS